MVMVTVHIWHNVSDGQILAIGRAPVDARHKAVPIAGPKQGVLEAQIEEDAISGLHETHRVDVRDKALVKVVP
jgi:hypothetical protein